MCNGRTLGPGLFAGSSMSAEQRLMIAEQQPVVFIIDDDPSLCDALVSLFRSVGLQVKAFGSGTGIPAEQATGWTKLPGARRKVAGTKWTRFPKRVGQANIQIPIVFMTGHGDISMTVRAMKAGVRRGDHVWQQNRPAAQTG
jgi:FixJ family two-component response regulator